MHARIHFISGLPRSGSTLLAALLRQNPRFHAGMSGPLAGMFGALLGEMSERNEFAVFLDDAKRRRILHALFHEFYADYEAGVIFDTSLAWCARMPAIADLFPEAKVIACVRHLPWIIDSIERLVQKNVFSPLPHPFSNTFPPVTLRRIPAWTTGKASSPPRAGSIRAGWIITGSPVNWYLPPRGKA